MESAHKHPNATKIPSVLSIDGTSYGLVAIRETGDVILDVTFENSRYATVSASADQPKTKLRNHVKPTRTRLMYRVRLDTLKKTSKYFNHLLGSDNFREGNLISASFAALDLRDQKPSEVEASDLPRIEIVDDDEASLMSGREAVLEDLLRILHGGEATTKPTIPFIASLAIMADRFGCSPLVARYVKGMKTFKWPATYGRAGKDGGCAMTPATEELLRQKILIAWLLDQPMRLAQCTKELILRGSSQWVMREDDDASRKATWWDLPDSLEAELLLRRECILNTLASIQNHYLRLYSSRERQCSLGYDSSAACDSYQLGEMIKFLTNKNLLHLISFSYTEYPEPYSGDIEHLITTLRQCPSYQIDKNHAHCGLRTKLLPCLEYVQSMLSGNIGIDRQRWKVSRNEDSWGRGETGKPWAFAGDVKDPRLKIEGNLASWRFARALFTACEWDWSPEENAAKAFGKGL